jgi:hypothetical protein
MRVSGCRGGTQALAFRGFAQAVRVEGRAVLAKHVSVFGPTSELFSAARVPAKNAALEECRPAFAIPSMPPSFPGDYPADKLYNDPKPIADCVGRFDAASTCAARGQRA